MSAEERLRVVVGTGERFLALEPTEDRRYGYGSTVSFSVGGLAGTWSTSFQDVPIFTREVRELHRSLTGEALLSDNDDSMSLWLRIDQLGHVTAAVNIDCGSSFGIEGGFSFEILTDQTYLAEIIRDLESAYPAAQTQRDDVVGKDSPR